MSEKSIKTRIQHKHDIEVNWNKATGFIPKIGELIVYDADETYSYPRFKVGDGVTSVVNLGFANEQISSTQVIHGEDKLQLSEIIDDKLGKIDNVSWNDLTDKPFGEENTVIFEGVFQNVQVDDDGDGVNDMWSGEPMIIEDTSSAALVEGQIYTVTWDGITYTTECVVAGDTPGIGNMDLMMGTGDNGMPFVIARDTTGDIMGTPSWAAFLTFPQTDLTISGAYTCKIEGNGIKHLDSKYLEFMNVQEENIVLPEQTVTLTLEDENEDNPEKSIFMRLFDSSSNFYTSLYNLEEGETYTVLWNDAEYTCTARPYGGEIPDTVTINKYVILGNDYCFSDAGTDTGEPFLISVADFINNDSPTETGQIITRHTSADASVDVNIKIYQPRVCEIDEDYLPNSGATSWEDLTDKPFGDQPAGTVVVPETTVNCDQQYGDYYYTFVNEPNIGLYSYIIEIDGESYEVTGEVDSDGATGLNCDGGILVKHFEGMSQYNLFISSQGVHTFKVTLAEDVVQKIDSKYLPDGLGSGSSLPEVTTNNNGQILTVVNGVWAAQSITHPTELPEVTSNDNEKVLTVVDGVWTAQSVTHPTELPEVTTDDAGKFLRVSSDGAWIAESIPNAEEASF